MSYSNSFNIGADNLVLGSATGTVNISSLGGEDILINGQSPSGGASLPLIGDGNITVQGNIKAQGDGVNTGLLEGVIIKATTGDIIVTQGKVDVLAGNVEISGTGNLEVKGTGEIKTEGGGDITAGLSGDIQTTAGDILSGKDIYFEGQDIYHRTNNPVANLSYKDFKQLPGKNDNNVYTGSNKFRSSALSIQALNSAVPAVYEDKITLNTDGNINCNEINNNTILKSNSIICENGSPDSQKVMARQYHFRPNSLETTGWVFSQKAPEAGAPAEDNYLMLQNTQATGSLNLVKSSFDPLNPTPFDIILDPQNGQVKTATSFDAPQVNFRKNAVDAWSIYQPPSGDANQSRLRIQNYQDNAGGVQILDNSNNIWVDFTNLFNTFNKPTFINDVLTVVANTVINNSYSLLFGAYSFKPIEITYAFTGATLDANPPTLFNSLTTNFTRTNDGATVVLNDLGEGVYILSIDATSSNGGTIGSSRFMCNFPYMVSANASGSFSFDGNFCINTTPPVGFIEPILEGDGTSGPIGSTNYSFAFSSITGTETYGGTVKITRLSY